MSYGSCRRIDTISSILAGSGPPLLPKSAAANPVAAAAAAKPTAGAAGRPTALIRGTPVVVAAASAAPATRKAHARAVEGERIPVGDGPTIRMPAIAGSVDPAGGYFGVVVTYFNALPSYTGS